MSCNRYLGWNSSSSNLAYVKSNIFLTELPGMSKAGSTVYR